MLKTFIELCSSSIHYLWIYRTFLTNDKNPSSEHLGVMFEKMLKQNDESFDLKMFDIMLDLAIQSRNVSWIDRLKNSFENILNMNYLQKLNMKKNLLL